MIRILFVLGLITIVFTSCNKISSERRSATTSSRLDISSISSSQPDGWGGFVSKAFSDILHRAASSDDVNNFSAALRSGQYSRASFAHFLLMSSEMWTYDIQNYYQTYLLRTADSGGLANNLNWALSGSPTREEVQASLIGTQEYFQKHGNSNSGFVTSLYANILNRTPDANGFANWLNVLTANQMTLSQEASGFLTGAEYRSDILIPGLYQHYLRRPVDVTGLSASLDSLNRGNRQESLIEGLVSSDEYYPLASTPMPLLNGTYNFVSNYQLVTCQDNYYPGQSSLQFRGTVQFFPNGNIHLCAGTMNGVAYNAGSLYRGPSPLCADGTYQISQDTGTPVLNFPGYTDDVITGSTFNEFPAIYNQLVPRSPLSPMGGTTPVVMGLVYGGPITRTSTGFHTSAPLPPPALNCFFYRALTTDFTGTP